MIRSLYYSWWMRNEMQKILREYQLKWSPLSQEERLKEMSREEIFAPAIEIPPEITILCYQFGSYWRCQLKSETLEYEKGIVPKGCFIMILYDPIDGMEERALFVLNWLAERGWSAQQTGAIFIPGANQ